jgi:hypothetical protein
MNKDVTARWTDRNNGMIFQLYSSHAPTVVNNKQPLGSFEERITQKIRGQKYEEQQSEDCFD